MYYTAMLDTPEVRSTQQSIIQSLAISKIVG